MKNQDQKLYYLLGGTDHETHDTQCCCGMPTDLPHKAYGASIYKLDSQGLQAMHAFFQGYDDVSFDEWMAEQEPEATYYGASEDAAIDEALIQARKRGLIVINYPQAEETPVTAEKETHPFMHVCSLQLPLEERITVSPTAYVEHILNDLRTYVEAHDGDPSAIAQYVAAAKEVLATHGWHLYPSGGTYHIVPLDQVKQYTLADASFLNSLKNQVRNVTKTLDTSKKVYSATIEARQVMHEVSVLLSELKVHGLFPIEDDLSMMTTLLKRAKDSFFSKIEQRQEELLTMDEADALSAIGEEIGTVIDAVLSERNISYTQALLLCCSEDVDLFLREPQALSCVRGNGINAQHCVYHDCIPARSIS